VQRVLAGDGFSHRWGETASSANQWALLPALLARAVCCCDPR